MKLFFDEMKSNLGFNKQLKEILIPDQSTCEHEHYSVPVEHITHLHRCSKCRYIEVNLSVFSPDEWKRVENE